MNRRKRRVKRTIPNNSNLMSVRLRLSKGYSTPTIELTDQQELEICNGSLERVSHLRVVRAIIENTGLQNETFCIHRCCDHPDCPILNFDFKSETDWGETSIGVDEPPVIHIRPPQSLNLKEYSHLKMCKTLLNRRVLTTTETENLVGSIIQATMPLYVSKEAQSRDEALGKRTTTSYLTTTEGDKRWIDIAAWNVFLNHA